MPISLPELNDDPLGLLGGPDPMGLHGELDPEAAIGRQAARRGLPNPSGGGPLAPYGTPTAPKAAESSDTFLGAPGQTATTKATIGGVDFINRAKALLGSHKGIGEACQMTMNKLYEGASWAGKTTQKSFDGYGAGENNSNLANRWFGADVSDRVNPRSAKTGDIVGWTNTYGNWKPGTITHVGSIMGRGEDGRLVVADHSRKDGLRFRAIDDPQYVARPRVA